MAHRAKLLNADRPAAVLLDAAGTLIHPARPVGELYAEVAAAHGAPVAAATLNAAFRAVFPRMPPMAFPPVTPDELDLLERGWWRRVVREVMAHGNAGLDDFDAFFDDLYERFARPDAWALYPEVEQALDRLLDGGLRLAVVSNFDSRLEPILAGLDLTRRLELVVYSTRAGAAKPDERIFALALEGLEVSAGRAVHVGDSRSADYEGAMAAGLEARWLVRDEPSAWRHADDHVVTDLARLADELLGRR